MKTYIRKLLKEALKQVSNTELIIEHGTELFHGTIEDFDPKQLRVGSYDNILWTTDAPIISQMYIPKSDSSMILDTNSIYKPSKDSKILAIQKVLGIDYDLNTVKWDRLDNAESYRPAPLFYKLFPRENYTEMTERSNGEPYEYFDFEKWSIDIKKWINEQLQKKLHYTPQSSISYDNNTMWRIRFHNGKLLKGDENAMGRLFVLTAKEDVKIYDATFGGTRESDLTDVDYHKFSWFETAKKQGYDGIRITDYAQSDYYGNFGHLSIGIFPNSIQKFNIDIIEDVSHPDNDTLDKWDFVGDSYRNWKSKRK